MLTRTHAESLNGPDVCWVVAWDANTRDSCGRRVRYRRSVEVSSAAEARAVAIAVVAEAAAGEVRLAGPPGSVTVPIHVLTSWNVVDGLLPTASPSAEQDRAGKLEALRWRIISALEQLLFEASVAGLARRSQLRELRREARAILLDR